MPAESELVLLTGNANIPLAQEISDILQVPVYNPIRNKHPNGESAMNSIPITVRNRDVFIVQPTSSPANDNLMELCMISDAAKRASARKVTAIIPYFGYGRQDRKDKPRVSVTSRLVVDFLLTSGVDHILTLDPHSEQILGFAPPSNAFDNLYGSHVLLPQIDVDILENTKISTVDIGGSKRARAMHNRLKTAGVVIIDKERDKFTSGTTKTLGMLGDIKGYKAFIVDDEIDTAGSLIDAANLLIENGALEVNAAATHGVFSNDAIERIQDSVIKKVYVTNSIRQKPEVLDCPKFKVVSIGPLISEAIRRIYYGKSLSQGLVD